MTQQEQSQWALFLYGLKSQLANIHLWLSYDQGWCFISYQCKRGKITYDMPQEERTELINWIIQ
jgi:hypothetical protein